MYEELKEKAVENLKEKREKTRNVHTVGVIFAAVSILLFVISLNFDPFVAYWIKLPILILALVYGIIYFATFGIPFISDDDELSDEEIEREIVKIYNQEGRPKSKKSEGIDELELREIETLKNKWEDNEDFV